MSKILVGIYDEHKLLEQALTSLIADNEDIKVIVTANDKLVLLEKLKAIQVNILIINLYAVSMSSLNFLIKLKIEFPKVRILVFSIDNSEDAILKTIKAGAKGFLDKDAGRKELVEAILTLRNGHDFYSNSITHLLLQRYVGRIKTNSRIQEPELESLSARQIEVLRLWGESFSNQEIAEKLFISQRTVETHKNHIMTKLNLRTTVDIIKFAIKNSLIEI